MPSTIVYSKGKIDFWKAEKSPLGFMLFKKLYLTTKCTKDI